MGDVKLQMSTPAPTFIVPESVMGTFTATPKTVVAIPLPEMLATPATTCAAVWVTVKLEMEPLTSADVKVTPVTSAEKLHGLSD